MAGQSKMTDIPIKNSGEEQTRASNLTGALRSARPAQRDAGASNTGLRYYYCTLTFTVAFSTFLLLSFVVKAERSGGHSIAPKITSANATNAKVRNHQMIGRPVVL